MVKYALLHIYFGTQNHFKMIASKKFQSTNELDFTYAKLSMVISTKLLPDFLSVLIWNGNIIIVSYGDPHAADHWYRLSWLHISLRDNMTGTVLYGTSFMGVWYYNVQFPGDVYRTSCVQVGNVPHIVH